MACGEWTHHGIGLSRLRQRIFSKTTILNNDAINNTVIEKLPMEYNNHVYTKIPSGGVEVRCFEGTYYYGGKYCFVVVVRSQNF